MIFTKDHYKVELSTYLFVYVKHEDFTYILYR